MTTLSEFAPGPDSSGSDPLEARTGEGTNTVQVGSERAGRRLVSVGTEPSPYLERAVTSELRALGAQALDVRGTPHLGELDIQVGALDEEAVALVVTRLHRLLTEVRVATQDESLVRDLVLDVAGHLDGSGGEGPDCAALLRWLADGRFLFAGYRRHVGGSTDSGAGVLRGRPVHDAVLTPPGPEAAVGGPALTMTLSRLPSPVDRSTHLTCIWVQPKVASGKQSVTHCFVGNLLPRAAADKLSSVPIIGRRLARLDESEPALAQVLDTYPREVALRAKHDELLAAARGVLHARRTRELHLATHRDACSGLITCVAHFPSDRFEHTVVARFAELLASGLGGRAVESSAHLDEDSTAHVVVVVEPVSEGLTSETDLDTLAGRLDTVGRSWDADLRVALSAQSPDRAPDLHRRYFPVLPDAYKDAISPVTAADDLCRLDALADESSTVSFDQSTQDSVTDARLRIYRTSSPMSLSSLLPLLSTMGVEVIDQHPYELLGPTRPSYIYDFGVRYPGRIPKASRGHVEEALSAVWDGLNEADGFNALVLAAGLTWRKVTLLRAYAKYMHQGGTPFTQDTVQESLCAHPAIALALVSLFEARFDPARRDEDKGAEAAAIAEILAALDEVRSLDHDRILRSYLTHIRATVRTSFFQSGVTGGFKSSIAFKVRPDEIPELPSPRPKFEIFVYSPRVEGVHLRFGMVARGGLRWSDRRDDFRTEVLGLVKAQMVKNAVIVPVGAKGGFFCKQLTPLDPTRPGDREAWLAEGVACYTLFISALLDVTDNIVQGEVVPPPSVVRHDDDDAYLVVAADKGTASFSDIANGVSTAYGHWLGDAFASGGSVGYDHKAMGITARGAWESVKRHFREAGIDCQTDDFTCVGIGDMSGDVFGNGMLLSEHTRLIAAFDHRDIFLDPDPETAASYAERARLFVLPRSSWRNYDEALISEGGGVYSRTAKSIPITEEVRAALSIGDGVTTMTPQELMRAILLAEVDLLWNGGIGTYVKSEAESHADSGDKTNDAIRVNGSQLRAKVVGEGGNLGLTQLGRIEYARFGCEGVGGRINTDFIDNSAGVDTSDREVNIKILLEGVRNSGGLAKAGRAQLLASMTNEVADLVLRDNYDQNKALATSSSEAVRQAPVHEDWMKRLEQRGVLDRKLEFMPSTKDVARRIESGLGLTVPELSVLMAYTKIFLADELTETDLPDEPFLRRLLKDYFPEPLRRTYAEQMQEHPLRREIVVTQAVNDLVNGTGTTYFHRLHEETGASAAQLMLASFAAREIFGSRQVVEKINALDTVVAAAVQTHMQIEIRDLVERAARWLVYSPALGLDMSQTVSRLAGPTQRVVAVLPELFRGHELESFADRRAQLMDEGVEHELATQVAAMVPAYTVLTIVSVADRVGTDEIDVARIHFALSERLHLSALTAKIRDLPRHDRYQTMARAALREEIHSVHGELTAAVVGSVLAGKHTGSTELALDEWAATHLAAVEKATHTLFSIASDDDAGLAALSVGVRALRNLFMSLPASLPTARTPSPRDPDG